MLAQNCPACWSYTRTAASIRISRTSRGGYLQSHPACSGKIGAVGFCFGIVNTLAVRLPDLGAAAPFYGSQPDAAGVANITKPQPNWHGSAPSIS